MVAVSTVTVPVRMIGIGIAVALRGADAARVLDMLSDLLGDLLGPGVRRGQ